MNHRPVCVKCNREMRPERYGVGCLDMVDLLAYAIWDCDLWKCRACGYEILVGFGKNAIVYHYTGEEFDKVRLDYEKASVLVESRSAE